MRNIKIVEKELDRAEKNLFKSTYSHDSKEEKILVDRHRKLSNEYFGMLSRKMDQVNRD